MIWKEKRVLLIVLALLLAANAAFFLTYRVQYQTRLDDLDGRLEQAEAQLLNARNLRLRAERNVSSYATVEANVKTVFEQHWSTRQERLTALIGEIKRLGEASGLIPSSYSFDQRTTQATVGLDRTRAETIGASEVGMSFGVRGTYAQVRRLINLLELSRQFVIIDEVALRTSDDQSLSLSLHIKTLFRDQQPPAAGRRL
jgi:hypothetical protein